MNRKKKTQVAGLINYKKLPGIVHGEKRQEDSRSYKHHGHDYGASVLQSSEKASLTSEIVGSILTMDT